MKTENILKVRKIVYRYCNLFYYSKGYLKNAQIVNQEGDIAIEILEWNTNKEDLSYYLQEKYFLYDEKYFSDLYNDFISKNAVSRWISKDDFIALFESEQGWYDECGNYFCQVNPTFCRLMGCYYELAKINNCSYSELIINYLRRHPEFI